MYHNDYASAKFLAPIKERKICESLNNLVR